MVDHLKALPPLLVGAFFSMGEHEKGEVLTILAKRLEGYVSEDGFEVPFRSYLATATL